MRILRSFPMDIPPGRAYVHDDLERFCMRDYDYSQIREYTEPLVLIEWDVAIDRANLQRFTGLAAGRDWPIVAPHYKLGDNGELHWVHFRLTADGGMRPVIPGEPECDQFAPGLAYLPGGLLHDCPAADEGSPIMNEGVISRYLRSRPDWRPVPIAWDITTVHLH